MLHSTFATPASLVFSWSFACWSSSKSFSCLDIWVKLMRLFLSQTEHLPHLLHGASFYHWLLLRTHPRRVCGGLRSWVFPLSLWVSLHISGERSMCSPFTSIAVVSSISSLKLPTAYISFPSLHMGSGTPSISASIYTCLCCSLSRCHSAFLLNLDTM